jgi:hypothetical protein
MTPVVPGDKVCGVGALKRTTPSVP